MLDLLPEAAIMQMGVFSKASGARTAPQVNPRSWAAW